MGYQAPPTSLYAVPYLKEGVSSSLKKPTASPIWACGMASKEARRSVKPAKPKKCPDCGTEVAEPYKTWELVAPLPDKKMRITITIMGMFQCPNCGRRFRGVVSKVKLGPEGAEVG